jgi:hypothetical protein
MMQARVRLREEPDRDVFIGTVLATGKTAETCDTRAMAAWLFARGVQAGRVSMPRESMPSAGDRMTLNDRLRQLWRAIGAEE